MNDLLKHTNQSYPTPENEPQRQAKLIEYDILDTLPEHEFDALVELAAMVTNSPVSLMNLLDHDRQWTKAAYGAEAGNEISRSDSVCQYTILNDDHLEVEDLKLDERFKDKDYVVDDPQYRSYSGFPLISPEGTKIGALCVLDFSPKTLTQVQRKALKTISEEIISRLELRKKQFELEQLNKEKDQIMRVINHDIKSPINGIIGSAHYLQEMWDGDREELNKVLSMISLSGQKLINYTRELMENSMFQHHSKLHLETVDILSVITDLIDIYQPLANAKDVSIEVKCSAGAKFYLDSEKYKLILSNLLSNALKFTESGDVITVDVEILPGNPYILHLTVADTGIGIPDHFLPDLFSDKKVHRRKGTRGEMSTGMGLPLVKKYVDLHGGGIKINTEIGKGTTFHIVLKDTRQA
ncbi:MAG: GAF domain-containing sensor histidine kinase [Gracilimonas sp.]|nr:GAF domain-containing sensor histidine kinase [Gracilimonas sp.]